MEVSLGTAASLPSALLLAVFACLPPQARARAALVCTTWRACADDPRLWTKVNLAEVDAFRAQHIPILRFGVDAKSAKSYERLLSGLAAKAKDELEELDIGPLLSPT